jgi:hypothetical protein
MRVRKLSEHLQAELSKTSLNLYVQMRRGVATKVTLSQADAYRLYLFMQEHIDQLANAYQDQEREKNQEP